MTQIKPHLFAAMDKLGTIGKHAQPESQDPMVPLLHEYNVSTLGESYFKARREKAKKALDKALDAQHRKKISDCVVSVKKNEIGESVSVIETDPYIFNVEIKNGASFLDTAALKTTLMKDHKMTALQVEALIEQCTDRREPSQSWRVVER